MASKKQPDINPETHNLWSIYGYPKFGSLDDRINEVAYSREEAHQKAEYFRAQGFQKLMIKPVKFRHDKPYKPRYEDKPFTY
jgi:hypothetical protein